MSLIAPFLFLSVAVLAAAGWLVVTRKRRPAREQAASQQAFDPPPNTRIRRGIVRRLDL